MLLGGDSKELFSILNIDLPLDPRLYVLGAFPKGGIGKRQLYLLHTLLLVARKMITLSWLKPLSLTIPQWQDMMNKVYIMERATVHLHIKMDLFRTRWAAVSVYFNLPV